jgi:hypothetical protein
MPDTGNMGSDFFLFSVTDGSQTPADLLVDVVQNRIPRKFGLDPLRDVQVLAPMYKGDVGIHVLNERLQAVLNPPDGDEDFQIGGRMFRIGDKVIQTRNNYEKDVYNGDIGFVHPGQAAEIKIDTFNFTRYGLLHGQVLTVSPDAVIRDRQQDRPNDRPNGRPLGTQNDTSEPNGQELNYSARISLDRTRMQIEDRMVNLSPGMAVTVEIKTGSRTILNYLLSPLLRYRNDTLRER